ncbi:MAG: hypothetical protein LBF08_00485 [Dysgonamonadaceae bacterium]|jgi:hypothetical protein|nr:hypothetical protein [Dysgonamonadaceae bacterium]
MKTDIKTTQKEFDTVETFRSIKEKISKEIRGLSYEELMDYFERNQLKQIKRTPQRY